eukprot:1191524-Prymnesium_polylepis.1
MAGWRGVDTRVRDHGGRVSGRARCASVAAHEEQLWCAVPESDHLGRVASERAAAGRGLEVGQRQHARGARGGVGACRAAVEAARQPEVAHLERAVGCEQQVGELEVAVHDV